MTTRYDLNELRDSLHKKERVALDAAMDSVFEVFKARGIPARGDDRAADLESAMAIFIRESRREF